MANATTPKGSTWASDRANERATVQQSFASDPKYKKYTQQVEKCLNSFDNVQEWADCIAFLKQLLKTFQSYMQFKEIPRKVIVAKRLAQCLNPALPTGVHQRALDVYAHILAVQGSEGLKRDLALWSSGLFPFFEYAATSVKPTLLNLYDTHYLPLQAGLRPVMKSFILALLPGLEEETGEFFEKVLSLLDRLSGTVSQSFFFQNIWLVMLTAPPARGTSINFLARRLPRLTGAEDLAGIVGSDIGLMIRAFSAALEDDNLLVRRGTLDILLQSVRLDSPAILRAQPDDRGILMRAAIGVVLRRDLSLNRRLYTWLLGPEEQVAYFREHGLALLKGTLREDMFSPSAEYSESRPFKIFISLLDKWEIGESLTEALVYDAFVAAKKLIEGGQLGAEDELTVTSSTLYEAIEPHVLWKHLLKRVLSDVEGGGEGTSAIDMALFALKTFPQDEEIQTMHLPVIFSGLIDVLNHQVQESTIKATTTTFRELFLLLDAILRQVPHVALLQRPELTAQMQEGSSTRRPYTYAVSFYGLPPTLELPVTGSSYDIPFVSIFDNLCSLSVRLSHSFAEAIQRSASIREVLSQSLFLLNRLVSRLSAAANVAWKPVPWLDAILKCLDGQFVNFTLVDRIVSLLVVLHQTKHLSPSLSIDNRRITGKMILKLLRYLQADFTAYHVRAVNLIWSLEAATKHPHVESLVAQTLTSPESRNTQEAYEAFGILWRLTEDNLLPGFKFKVPMMIVLDTLKKDDPCFRRLGETWMRCSLKSYIRVLDPILYDLLDPSIRQIPSAVKAKGREIQGFYYELPFDQRYCNHLLDMLLSVIRFGGQGFSKAARNTSVHRTYHPGLLQRVITGGWKDPETNYQNVLSEILLRFLQSEPRQALGASMNPPNALLQSTSVDLLQAIVARGELDLVSIQAMEAVVVGKLYSCVHTIRLDLQNKLLHLLHSLIAASTATEEFESRQRQESERSGSVEGGEASTSGSSVNPLLVQTLVDGITTLSNRPVLQHWLDFVLMAVPQFQPTLQTAVTPLNDCLCRQLQSTLDDALAILSKKDHHGDDITSTTTDAEFVMLLNGVERLVLLNLAYTSEQSSMEDEHLVAEKSPQEPGGVLGFMTNVFTSESAQQNSDEHLTARSPGYRALHQGLRVLYIAWGSLVWDQPEAQTSVDDSLSVMFSRARARCRRVLEHLFRLHGFEVLESIVECWSRESTKNVSPTAAFELVDVLVGTSQSVVHMICETISIRIPGTSEKSKRQAVNPDLSDSTIFSFLEQYISRLEGPVALQVWNRYLQLMKDIQGGSKDFKIQLFPALRCLAVLADKLTQTTAMEDRRIRKDVQETFGRSLDSCVTYVGRSSDFGSWIRRSAKETLATNGRESPVARNDVKIDEKMNASTTSLQPETPKPGLSEEITLFVASIALPQLRRFLMDNDKITAACNNIVYYIVGPGLKGKLRPMDVDDTILAIIRELSRIPMALKAWRLPVVELINDNRVFNCSPEVGEKWKPIVKSLFDADKTAFPELLAKVSAVQSANIFTSKEYEMLLRSLNLRRVSLVLYAAEKNHFLTQLPSIQEKLVDILRNVTAPMVQSEVYLCIRVLLCRLSPHNLTSFWPVILTEMYRVFEQAMADLPPDGSDDLQLVLAASKCLDLLLTLQTEEFQIYQWIFITDTVDAIYRPNEWFPEAMLDQLAEIAGSLPRAGAGNSSVIGPAATHPSGFVTTNGGGSGNYLRPLRRPQLGSLKSIDSIRDLIPFFSNISISTYEGVYASAGSIDWDAVERYLLDDMFDGQ